MRSKGFLPLNEFFKLKSKKEDSNNTDTLTPELDDTTKALREESEEGSDELEEIAPVQDTCAHSVVSISDGESEEILPQHNVRPRLRRFACMESEESTGDEDNGNDGDYAKRFTGEDKTDDEETHTASKKFEVLRREVLLYQEESKKIPGSTFQVLGDRPGLLEALAQLTKEAKRTDLDVIVRARIAAMVGLLNIYTDQNLQYSWIRTSQVVAKMQGRGTDHARHIRDWTMAYLRRRDLPLHQLKWKRPTIVDDEDLAEEIRTQMKEKAGKGFLKAEDVVEIVASPEIQAIFAQKGISKPTISISTALRWLEKLGWTYGKLKNGMYLDGHERDDVVEYRKAFVERWMGYERRFHQWDNDGTELPRPNGFPVPGAIGRFRLILVTHDESTFFQNDERNTGWSHATSKSTPKAKGNGQSLMVSDFLTPDWGRLRDGDE